MYTICIIDCSGNLDYITKILGKKITYKEDTIIYIGKREIFDQYKPKKYSYQLKYEDKTPYDVLLIPPTCIKNTFGIINDILNKVDVWWILEHRDNILSNAVNVYQHIYDCILEIRTKEEYHGIVELAIIDGDKQDETLYYDGRCIYLNNVNADYRFNKEDHKKKIEKIEQEFVYFSLNRKILNYLYGYDVEINLDKRFNVFGFLDIYPYDCCKKANNTDNDIMNLICQGLQKLDNISNKDYNKYIEVLLFPLRDISYKRALDLVLYMNENISCFRESLESCLNEILLISMVLWKYYKNEKEGLGYYYMKSLNYIIILLEKIEANEWRSKFISFIDDNTKESDIVMDDNTTIDMYIDKLKHKIGLPLHCAHDLLISCPVLLKVCEEKYVTNEVCIAIIEKNPLDIKYVPDKYINDEVYAMALINNKDVLAIIGEDKLNKYICEIVFRFCNHDTANKLKPYLDNIGCDEDFYKETFRNRIDRIDIIPLEYIDQDMCNEAISYDNYLIKYIPTKFITEEICDKIIAESYYYIKYVPEELRKNYID